MPLLVASMNVSIVWCVVVGTQCLLLLLNLYSLSDGSVCLRCLENKLLILCVYRIHPVGYVSPSGLFYFELKQNSGFYLKV